MFIATDSHQTTLQVQIPHIHFGSQVTHLEQSTKTNHPLNRTLVIRFHCYPSAIAKSGLKRSNGAATARQANRWVNIRPYYALVPTRFSIWAFYSSLPETRYSECQMKSSGVLALGITAPIAWCGKSDLQCNFGVHYRRGSLRKLEALREMTTGDSCSKLRMLRVPVWITKCRPD